MNAYSIPLDHLDLVCFRGEDSAKFLQGQLTCDVLALGEGHSTLGACCNVKGRIIANFLLFKTPEGLFLELPAGSGQLLLENLRKFMVFYRRCEALPYTEDFQRLGLWGPEVEQTLSRHWPALPSQPGEAIPHQGHWLLLLPGASLDSPPRYELWLSRDQAEGLLTSLSGDLPQGNMADWELANMRAGVHLIPPEQSGLFTPQLLNLDLNGGVSFSKGCYTGQEIVARMHFRGSAKKRLHHLTLPEMPEDKGDLILHGANGETKAELVHAASNGSHHEALVIMNTDPTATDGGHHLDASSEALRVKPFHYPA